MKKFKRTFALIAWIAAFGFLFFACDEDLDIKQDYSFDLETMPVQSKIIQGETVEIRCKLIKEGDYESAKYYIRYFQSSGVGTLRLDNGIILEPNDLYQLTSDNFYLYYTSACTDQQTIDVYITDNFGQLVQKSFGFQNENPEVEEPVNIKYTFETLPVPSTILVNDTIEIRCQIVKEDERNDAAYSIRYFQAAGTGKLVLSDGTVLKPNDLYRLNGEAFNLYYVSNCEERQTIDVYILDSNGQAVQKTFTFENEYIEPEPEIDMSFELEVLPVPKSLIEGETIEMRCRIKRADTRNDTKYYIRYFQPDGKGVLRLDYGVTLKPNDLYYLKYDTFRLYYTSNCSVQQTVDIYIVDQSGQVVQKSFSFQNEKVEETEDETIL